MSVATTTQSPAPPEGAVNGHNPSLRIIPVSQIVPSETNPPSRCHGPEFDELVDSVRMHGVLQPILVRPFGTDHHFEIVAGERRFRAAVQVGLPLVPAMVRELTDLQAHELQLIENLQRKDISVLEEATGYAQLLDAMAKEQPEAKRQDLVEQIAKKIGKSLRYVYARMKLDQLVPQVKQALVEGKIEASHADVLVTLPAAKQVEVFFENFVQPRYGTTGREAEGTQAPVFIHDGEEYDWTERAPSVRDLKENLKRNGTELKRAPWKWAKDTEAKLAVAGAPPCVGCEFNTASQEDGDAKRALCLNDSCFEDKKTKFVQVQIAACVGAPIRVSDSHYEKTKGVLNHSNWEKAAPGSCESVVAAAQYDYEGKPEKFFHVCTNKKCKVHFKASETSRSVKSPQEIRRESELKEENTTRLAIAKKVVASTEALPAIVIRQLAQDAAEEWSAREQVGAILPSARADLKNAKDGSAQLAKAIVAVMLAPFSQAKSYSGAHDGRKEFDATVMNLGFDIAKERAGLAGANVVAGKAAPKAAETGTSKVAAKKSPAKKSKRPSPKAASSKPAKKKASAKKGGR